MGGLLDRLVCACCVQVGMFRLYELLQQQLPVQLTIASPIDYPTYKLYILSFGERGGEWQCHVHMHVYTTCMMQR